MKNLNYNHLRYFWAVAHEGSLTRAAERLNLSQSAVSVQIQKLEHEIAHPLFERVGKKLILTEAGRIALDYADTVFKTGDELMSTLDGGPLLLRRRLGLPFPAVDALVDRAKLGRDLPMPCKARCITVEMRRATAGLP